jgi:hypothetical protein
VKSTIFHWLLILFLLSGGLPTELVIAPSHIEFAAEEDLFSFDRQDELFKPSVSRKRSSRARKEKLPPATSLATTTAPPSPMFFAGPPSPAIPSHRNLHQFHEVFCI